MAAVPQPDPRGNRARKRVPLKGEIANAANPPAGCSFHPRCPYAQAKCATEVPALRTVTGGRQVRCHFAEELSLVGAVA
ncbi:dipeptide transporter ATP-binding subunit [compost metagenome]